MYLDCIIFIQELEGMEEIEKNNIFLKVDNTFKMKDIFF